jgi:hypothetical protein
VNKRSILYFFLFPLLLSPFLQAQPPARPVIAHEAPASVVSGQPLRVVARVSSPDQIKEVNLYLAQSAGVAPVKLPLRAAGAGVYSVQINPEQFAGVPSFRYYLDARSEPGAFTETNWMTVQVIGSGGSAVVAVGAGVAVAGGGGGGGGNDNNDGGTPTDPADQILVRTASDQVNEAGLLLPQADVVDVAPDLAGRSIKRVRIQLTFNALDGGEEEYQIIYNGATVISGRTAAPVSEQVDVVGSADTQVLMRVVDSVPVDGKQAYRWDLTVTYFLE